MAAHDIPAKSAHATSTTLDLEHGRDDPNAITPSASSLSSPEGPRSKAATPTVRRSLEVEDVVPRHSRGAFALPRALEEKVPRSVLRWSRKTADWVRGPPDAQLHRIKPLWERWQTLPVRTLARLPRGLRWAVYAVACVLWVVIFAVVVNNYSLPRQVVSLGCVASLWYVLFCLPRLGT